MKRKQIWVLWSGILVIIAMLLFPPYRFVIKNSTSISGPYRLIFLGVPNVPVDYTWTDKILDKTYTKEYYKNHEVSIWKTEIDKTRLLIPVFVVVIITTGLIITLNRKGQKPD